MMRTLLYSSLMTGGIVGALHLGKALRDSISSPKREQQQEQQEQRSFTNPRQVISIFAFCGVAVAGFDLLQAQTAFKRSLDSFGSSSSSSSDTAFQLTFDNLIDAQYWAFTVFGVATGLAVVGDLVNEH